MPSFAAMVGCWMCITKWEMLMVANTVVYFIPLQRNDGNLSASIGATVPLAVDVDSKGPVDFLASEGYVRIELVKLDSFYMPMDTHFSVVPRGLFYSTQQSLNARRTSLDIVLVQNNEAERETLDGTQYCIGLFVFVDVCFCFPSVPGHWRVECSSNGIYIVGRWRFSGGWPILVDKVQQ
jgi:hypothetical protein